MANNKMIRNKILDPSMILRIQNHTIPFTELTNTTNITDIKDTKNLDPVHHYLYAEHTFPSKGSSIAPSLDETQELLTVSGFHFCTLKNDTCISDSLRENILFEKFLLSLLSKVVNHNKNMLDVGSNIGVWSIVYSTFIKGTIHAFEPQSEVFKCLTHNIAINQCNNVIAHDFALSDKSTTYLMNASYDHKDNFGSFRISEEGSLSIQSEIGDTLNLSNIGFIKMDVEGHELQALQGLSNTIRQSKPVLLIEIHSTQYNCNETFKYIIELGYKHVLKITHCDYLFVYDKMD